MLWAAIHLPRRALDAALRRQPDPSAPLALADGPPQRRLVVQANASALAAGVRAGQPLAAAMALCPTLACVSFDAGEASRLLDLACAWAYRQKPTCTWPARANAR